MIGSELFGRSTRDFSLAELCFRKSDRECMNSGLCAASKRSNGRRIHSATEENSDRHIGNQVSCNGFFEHPTKARGGILVTSRWVFVRRSAESPVRLRVYIVDGRPR